MTSPGETDVLLVFAAIMLIGAVLALGVLFLWLHSLPERMVHNATKWQIDLVAVLCLLSLFTHVHAFWVAALLLAFVKVPDFVLPDVSSPLGRIAGSLELLANRPMSAPAGVPTAAAAVSAEPPAAAKPAPQKPTAPTGKSHA